LKKKSKCFEEEVEFNIKICGQANDANDKSYINNDQYEKSIGNESDIKTNFSKKNKLNNKTTLEIKEEMSCSKTQKTSANSIKAIASRTKSNIKNLQIDIIYENDTKSTCCSGGYKCMIF